ncbi:Transmembrane and TPR repeat-containing protein [Amphibalanus amphitrite]|uniref:dolichyl-phosphate-mannose--protein mannosyltransferase n=1 Tax=Amphibalanus amphitrite TaxID=1232801 RepID=A0A6A4X153_AMPAM|nr:Transmembrane and TPR repeat-containing protein [Amphibalanus amphitrite]
MLQRWSYPCLLALAVTLCYQNALHCDLVFDDVRAVHGNRDLRPDTPVSSLLSNDFWGTPMEKDHSHKSYRPLCVLTFRWNYFFHQLSPMGYHIVNVILHGLVCFLYFRSVTGVVGRAELLSALFFTSAFLAYTRSVRSRTTTDWRWMFVSMVCVTASLLSKEQGITIVGVCVTYELFVVQKVSLRRSELQYLLRSLVSGKVPPPGWLTESAPRLTALTVTGLSLLLARVRVMGARLPVFNRFDNPAAAAGWPTRQLTHSYLTAVNSGLLLAPDPLCCDWTMGTVPLVSSIGDRRNFSPLAVAAALCLLLQRAVGDYDRHSSVILTGLSLLVIPFVPASNLLFPVGFVVAERVLYIPSMGFCLLVAAGFHKMTRYRRYSTLLRACICLLLVCHGLKTYRRNQDWRDELSLFTAGLRVNRNNAKLYNNVGHVLENRSQLQEALAFFQQAARVQPDDIGAYINIGRAFNSLKMYPEAEHAYLKARSLLPRRRPGAGAHQSRVPPHHLTVLFSLANLVSRDPARLEEADTFYREAISMRADYTQAYINRGDVLVRLNRTREAQRTYETALFYDNDNPDIYYNLGIVYLEQGRLAQALAHLDRALELAPDHQQALLNSATIIQESGAARLRPTARLRLRRLLQLSPAVVGAERVHFNLGMLAMDERDLPAAETHFRKLIKYQPDHIKGLILLGDIYVSGTKDLDAAERCYEHILRLDPDHVQGLHNLCVVYVERAELARAEQCLLRAVHLAPHEEYIQRHLRIVREQRRTADAQEALPCPGAGAAPSGRAAGS